jgi:hypothetical protein
METGTIAIMISVFSTAVAATSLGWNIYRDIILKARVHVNLAIKNIIQEGAPASPDYIGIHATNHGPGTISLSTISLMQSSIWRRVLRRRKFAFLMHDYENPYSAKLPRKLEVGESMDLFFNYDADCFLREAFTHLGLNDSFGRTHWVPRKSMRRLRQKWLTEFGEKDASK